MIPSWATRKKSNNLKISNKLWIFYFTKSKKSILFLQPLLQDGAVLVCLLDEASVASAFEDLPAAVGNVLVERGGHHGRADVAGAAANQARLFDLVEAVGVFEIGQVT